MRALFPKTPVAKNSFCITNVNLVDGTGSHVREGVSVLIKDGVIADVMDSSVPVEHGQDVALINAYGAFLLPGFIDAHLHFGVNLELDPAYLQRRLAVESEFTEGLDGRCNHRERPWRD